MPADQNNSTPRRSLLRGVSWFGSFAGLLIIVRLVRGAIIPKILAPGPYGLWSSIVVVQRYLVFADLGVLAQYRKRFPLLVGQGKEEEARKMEAQTMGLVTVAAVVVALGLATAGLCIPTHREFYMPALLMLAVVTMLQRTRLVTMTALSARERFRLTSIASSLFTLTDMAAALSLIWVMGVIGLPAGLLVGELVTLGYLLIVFRPPRPAMPDRAFLGAILEGLLLLGVQFSAEFLFSSDRLMLVLLASSRELGLYSLSMFGVALLLIPSGIFLTVLQPRIMRLTGAGEHREARQILEAGLALYLLLSIAVVIVALPSFSLLLAHYFTKYTGGMVAAYILFSLVFFQGPILLLRVHYLSNNREKVLVTLQVLFGILGCGLSAAALQLGHSIAGVATASLMAQALFSVALWIDFERKAAGSVGLAKYVILAGGLTVYLALAHSLSTRAEVASLLADAQGVLARAGLALVLVLAACAAGHKWIVATTRPFLKA